MGMGNLLRGKVQEVEGSCAVVHWAGHSLLVRAGEGIETGTNITLGIRPEEIMISRRDRRGEGGGEENLLRGVIVKDRPQGFDHLVDFQIGDRAKQCLTVRIPHPILLKLTLEVGQRRTLLVRPDAIHVIPPPAGSPHSSGRNP
jgi:hypothetical protein